MRVLAEARARMRLETVPGKQLRIDFGDRLVAIAGCKVNVFLLVATLSTRADATCGGFATSTRRAGSTAWPPDATLLAWEPRQGERLPELRRGFMRAAISGRSFVGWEASEVGPPRSVQARVKRRGALAAWERDVAHAQVFGMTGEAPMVRFARATRRRPCSHWPPGDHSVGVQSGVERCHRSTKSSCGNDRTNK